MTCRKCGGPTTMQVQGTITAPSSLYRDLSKGHLRRKDVYLMGADWKATDIICDDPKCGHVLEGIKDVRPLYDELLMAVGNVYPGETRHQTALRYIRQAESNISGPAQATTPAQAGNEPAEAGNP